MNRELRKNNTKKSTISNEYNIDLDKVKDTSTHEIFASIMDNVTSYGYGKYRTSDELKVEDMLGIIDENTMMIGTLTKPFTIMAQLSDKNNLPNACGYYHKLESAAWEINNKIQNEIILNSFRHILLDEFHTVAALIQNEFESISDKVIQQLTDEGITLSDTLSFIYRTSFDINNIHRLIEELYGISLYKATDEDTFKYVNLYVTPIANMYSAYAVTSLTSIVYNNLYRALFIDCDSSDFDIIARALVPIFVSFRDDIKDLVLGLTHMLLHTRVSNPLGYQKYYDDLMKRAGIADSRYCEDDY